MQGKELKNSKKTQNEGWKCFSQKQLEQFHSIYQRYKGSDGFLTQKNFIKAFHKIGSIPSQEDQYAMCQEWAYSKTNDQFVLQKKKSYSEPEFLLILYHYFRYSCSEAELKSILTFFADPDGTLTKERVSDVLKNLKHPLSTSTITKIISSLPPTQEKVSISDLIKAIKPYSFY